MLEIYEDGYYKVQSWVILFDSGSLFLCTFGCGYWVFHDWSTHANDIFGCEGSDW